MALKFFFPFVRCLKALKENEEMEALIMKDVPGWTVGESVYNTEKWITPVPLQVKKLWCQQNLRHWVQEGRQENHSTLNVTCLFKTLGILNGGYAFVHCTSSSSLLVIQRIVKLIIALLINKEVCPKKLCQPNEFATFDTSRAKMNLPLIVGTALNQYPLPSHFGLNNISSLYLSHD